MAHSCAGPCSSVAATAQVVPPGFAIPEPSVSGDDILNVTVFTQLAAAGSGTLPVVVWIHGGGFTAGSPVSDWYDGRTLAQEGVVVVSVGYRLGLEGFGVVPGAPDNRGMLDWICALEWVRDNISAFGGDPDNVTIAGQSAGGMAVLALAASRRADGLFRRVWTLSGPTGDLPRSVAARHLEAALAERGLEYSLESLLSLPRGDDVIARLDITTGAAGLRFGPVSGDDLLPDGIVRGLAEAVVPIVAGTTADEWFFDNSPPALDENIAHAMLSGAGVDVEAARRGIEVIVADRGHLSANAIASEMLFRAGLVRLVDARSEAPGSTWIYDFRVRRPVSGLSVHCDDIPAFFGVVDATSVVRAGLSPITPELTRLHADVLAYFRGEELSWSRSSASAVNAGHGYTVYGDASDSDDYAVGALFLPSGG
jgi:para-nitrobenzyl esterase